MKEYKPGDTVNVNGIDLLVLDDFEDSVYVLAYNLDIKTEFDSKSNNYITSELRKMAEQWLSTTKFLPIERTILFNTVCDITVYDSLTTKIAPLTFDEYRKYYSIIKPHIKNWFWLANKWSEDSTTRVCRVLNDGEPDYNYYDNTYGSLVPTFILSKSDLENPLSRFTTDELLKEIHNRTS